MHKLIGGGLATVFALSAAAQHAAHEHGVAELEVAVDGTTLAMALRGPLENFIGFEHAPRTKAERSALDQALALLRDPAQVVVLPAAAGCRAAEVEVPDPFAEEGRTHEEGPDEGPGHADLGASYRFECAKPAALSGLELKLFEAFPRLTRLRAVSATPRGQHAAELLRGKSALPL